MAKKQHDKYENLSVQELENELRRERKLRETVELDNAVLEKCILECDSILMDLQNNYGHADEKGDCEWKIRYENQFNLNRQLESEIYFIEKDISEIILRLTQRDCRKIQILTQSTSADAINFNLDGLNEKELYRLMKHLERMRTSLYSTLKDTEWKLEKAINEFQHLDMVRQVYRIELEKINMALINLEPLKAAKILDDNCPRKKKPRKKKREGKTKKKKRKEESKEESPKSDSSPSKSSEEIKTDAKPSFTLKVPEMERARTDVKIEDNSEGKDNESKGDETEVTVES